MVLAICLSTVTLLVSIALYSVFSTNSMQYIQTARSTMSCFTPNQNCLSLVVRTVDDAQSELLVQAYGFSSRPIIDALIRAERRGVDVRVILDRSDVRNLGSASSVGAEAMANANIPVFIDLVTGIAHNKVIIVDRHIVLTGSYNFTAAAEARNAENVVLIYSIKTASEFVQNWTSRQMASVPWKPANSE
jgi:phosphatidylserine/phosphatidylglycerophosphate/cardiolipin synthase-like enzyme